MTTATYRAIRPDWQWHMLANHLAAAQADLLKLLWWSKTKDGQKGLNRPKPIMRPGIDGYGHDPQKELEQLDIDAIEATLAAPRIAIDAPG